MDIFPKLNNDLSGTGGIILFKDIEAGSPMFERVNLVIEIANLHFGMGLLPLKG